MSQRLVRKTIFRIFVLRVSGKGDLKGSANQLEVLRGYEHVPGVAWLLDHFDIDIMRASSARGRKLRADWQKLYGLELLRRSGRDDFLGVSLVVDGTRFVIYASSASQLDEEAGNAFTRHLIRFIKDPAFTGHADPEFTQRRDNGTLEELEHPSVCNAFDATRFVRSLPRASELWEAAKSARAAFDVKEVRVDPEGGEAQELIWQFLAYGSQMEAEIGKIRRFVGQLNLARAGYFPSRAASAPLGLTTTDGKARPLVVRDGDVQAVAALYELGMTGKDFADIALALGTQYKVTSRDIKTTGTPIHRLEHPADAARRLFLRRKLLAYRDGELEMRFVGVLPNRLRPGSGHVLKRRWLGLNAHGRHDELGEITYRIPAPKPTVLDHDGQPRPGWLAGVSAEAERDMWSALIEKRGWDDRRGDGAADVFEADHQYGTADVHGGALLSTPSARSGARRFDEPVMALARLCLFRDEEAGEDGPRTKLFPRGSGGRYELRREREAPKRAGIKYNRTEIVASWQDHELRGHVAALLRRIAHRLIDEGHELGPLAVTLSDSATHHSADREHQAEVDRLRAEAATHRRLATGYDRAEAEEMACDERDEERLGSLREQSREARRTARALEKEADGLTAAAARPLPEADFGQLRDVIAALEGAYASGLVPPALNRALREMLPGGLTFRPGPDSLTIVMVATVELPLTVGGTICVTDELAIPHSAGRGETDLGEQRLADLIKRYMANGDSIEEVARVGRIKSTDHMLRMVREGMSPNGAARVDLRSRPNATNCNLVSVLRNAAFSSPIPELRAVVWHQLTGTPGRPTTATTAYSDLIANVYVQEASDAQPDTTPNEQRKEWAWDPNTDRRADQHTILQALPGPAKQMRADHLGAALATANADPRHGLRLVLESSTDHPRNGKLYPKTLRRLPAPGHPGGWYAHQSNALSAADKLVCLPECPHADCRERYATAIIFAPEVMHFGTSVVCRRCKRPAVDTADARRTVFPDSLIAWSDSQPRRTGSWVACGAAGCRIDVGAGPGLAWRWDDSTTSAWHDDNCRTGAPAPSTYRTCQFADCTIDEGGGPGSVAIDGQRSSKRWHTRDCEHAEKRRRRRLSRDARFGQCANADCTIDEGNGPGSIAGPHHVQKTHDNRECHNAARRRGRIK